MDYYSTDTYTVGPLLYAEDDYYIVYEYLDTSGNANKNIVDVNGILYEIHDFERPVYLYLWPILVSVTCLLNILLLSVLMGRSMRSAVTVLFSAVSASETLTCLVTMPAIIHVYASDSTSTSKDGRLAGDWCFAYLFLVSYLSKLFHTMAIWLTVLLGFNAWIAVASPYRARRVCTIRNTFVLMVVVVVLSSVLHVHALVRLPAHNNGTDGRCALETLESCADGCIYNIWLLFAFMHAIPCFLVIVIIILMVSFILNNYSSVNNRTNQGPDENNVRMMIIAVIVAIVFLIPHATYVLYMLLHLVQHYSDNSLIVSFKTRRIFHCFYDNLLVLTFLLKFWIFLALDERFRDALRRFLSCSRSTARAQRQHVAEHSPEMSFNKVQTLEKPWDSSFKIQVSHIPKMADEEM